MIHTGKTVCGLEPALRVAREMRLPDGAMVRATTLPEIDRAAKDETSRRVLAEAAGWYMTCSLGIYVGVGKTPIPGIDIENHLDYSWGTKVILGGNSIPEKANGVQDAFLFYPEITLEQINTSDRKIVYSPDRESAVVLAPFPQKDGWTGVFAGVLGSEGVRCVLKYNDKGAPRIGFIIRSVYEDGYGPSQYIAICTRSYDASGLAVVELGRKETVPAAGLRSVEPVPLRAERLDCVLQKT